MDYEKKRKKNFIINAFLKGKLHAVDLAIKRRNISKYNCSNPYFYISDIKDNNEDFLNKKKENGVNKYNKKEKTYNNIKNNLIGKTISINNLIINKENKNKRNINSYNSKNNELGLIKSDDEELINYLMAIENKNKKFQEIHKYSGNFSSDKNVTNKEKMNDKEVQTDINNMYYKNDIKKGFGNNLKIERMNETNYNNQDNNKNSNSITSSNMTKNKEYLTKENN